MINFLDLLFPSASGAIAKSLSEIRTMFSSSRSPSGENTGGPQGAHSFLANGCVEAEAQKLQSDTVLSFFLSSSIFIIGWATAPILSFQKYLSNSSFSNDSRLLFTQTHKNMFFFPPAMLLSLTDHCLHSHFLSHSLPLTYL